MGWCCGLTCQLALAHTIIYPTRPLRQTNQDRGHKGSRSTLRQLGGGY